MSTVLRCTLRFGSILSVLLLQSLLNTVLPFLPEAAEYVWSITQHKTDRFKIREKPHLRDGKMKSVLRPPSFDYITPNYP
jgi:hypothetical protein